MIFSFPSPPYHHFDYVFTGEYGRDHTQSHGRSSNAEDGEADNVSSGSSGAIADGIDAGGRPARRNRWFELDGDSDSSDWEDDEEDETSPFFGRCALRSLLCRDGDSEESGASGSSDDSRGAGESNSGNGSSGSGNSSSGNRSRGPDQNCTCTCECGGIARPGLHSGGVTGLAPVSAAGVIVGGRCDGGCCGCEDGDQGMPSITQRPVDADMVPLPLTGRSRPPPEILGEANLHRRRGWGFGAGGGNAGGLATTRDEEEGAVVRARGRSGGGGGGGQDLDMLDVQRPTRQAMV